MFLYEEKQSLKSAKWEACALKGKLVGFDGHTIYRVHIEDQNKVIRVKDLRIFEDITSKTTTSLPDFEEKPMFDGVQIPDEQGPSDKSSTSEEEENKPKKPPQNVSKTHVGRDANRPSKKEIEPKRATLEKQARSWAGREIKQTPKARDDNVIHTLVTQLASLLDKDWEEEEKISALLASWENSQKENSTYETKMDPLQILAASIQKANAGNPADFLSTTQLDIEELEMYKQAISKRQAQQWAHGIQDKFEQLEKTKPGG